MITHIYNFVGPISGVCIENVESSNNKFKMVIIVQEGVIDQDGPRFLTFFNYIVVHEGKAINDTIEFLRYH